MTNHLTPAQKADMLRELAEYARHACFDGETEMGIFAERLLERAAELEAAEAKKTFTTRYHWTTCPAFLDRYAVCICVPAPVAGKDGEGKRVAAADAAPIGAMAAISESASPSPSDKPGPSSTLLQPSLQYGDIPLGRTMSINGRWKEGVAEPFIFEDDPTPIPAQAAPTADTGERTWCASCGTVSSDGTCDCTNMGYPERRKAEPYIEAAPTSAGELLPCPFCGLDDPVYENTVTDATVRCRRCRAGITRKHHPTIDDGLGKAKADWNRRAPSSPAKAGEHEGTK